MKRSKVLIADDHGMVIDGLRGLLEPEYEVVGAVNDGRAVLARSSKTEARRCDHRYFDALVEWP